jgi:cytochrome c oxidase subunit 2
MRFRVIALGPKEFNEWLDQQLAPARNIEATAGNGQPKAQFASLKSDWKRNEKGWSEQFDLNPLESWKAKQFPDKDEDPALIAKGRKLFTEKTCFSCHVIRGHHIGGSPAYPDLTHVGARTTIAAGLLENTPDQLGRWISHPDQVKPGNKMYVNGYLANHIQLNPDDVHALVAYLESLK